MSAHNLYPQLNDKGLDAPASGRILQVPGVGYLISWGAGDPTDQGYAKGCVHIDTSTGTPRKNTGTLTAAVWADV